jgi:hypothetical protein
VCVCVNWCVWISVCVEKEQGEFLGNAEEDFDVCIYMHEVYMSSNCIFFGFVLGLVCVCVCLCVSVCKRTA